MIDMNTSYRKSHILSIGKIYFMEIFAEKTYYFSMIY